MAGASIEQLMARLAKGQAIAALALVGPDLYLRDVCRAKLIETFVPEGAREWGVSRFSLDDVDLSRVLQQAQTLPMLAPRQVVFVEDLDALDRLGEDSREGVVKALEAYLRNPAPFTLLVFEAASLDQRTKLFKLLSAKTLVVSMELAQGGSDDDRQKATISAAAEMVPQMAQQFGATIDAEAAEELAEMLNGELAHIRTELEKLATYVGERKRITAADVDTMVVAEQKYSVWQLADMLAGRKRDNAFRFLDSLLREGEGPAGLVGALAWMYRKLIEAQEAPAQLKGWEAARQLRMKAETAELALRQSRRIPRAQLLAGLQALYEADARLKSGFRDDRAVMEFLLARLTA